MARASRSLAILLMVSTVAALCLNAFSRFETDNSIHLFTESTTVNTKEENDIMAPDPTYDYAERLSDLVPNAISIPPADPETTVVPTVIPTTSYLSSTTLPPMAIENVPVAMQSSAVSGGSTDVTRSFILLVVVYLIFMLALFVLLSNINSGPMAIDLENQLQAVEMNIDNNGYDSSVVLDLPSYGIDTSQAFYLPGYRKQLSVVREVSQEFDF